MLSNDSRIVVEMGVEELDFLDEFRQELSRTATEGSYTWSDVLESYVRAREHYSLRGGFCVAVPRSSTG